MHKRILVPGANKQEQGPPPPHLNRLQGMGQDIMTPEIPMIYTPTTTKTTMKRGGQKPREKESPSMNQYGRAKHLRVQQQQYEFQIEKHCRQRA